MIRLNTELAETIVEDCTAEAGHPKTIICDSPPWWRLVDDQGRIICVNYRHDEEEAISEMIDCVIASEGEHFLSIWGDHQKEPLPVALAKWAECTPYFVAIKSGSSRRQVIPTESIIEYL